MKYTDHFDVCLMYQNHQLLQDFIHYKIEGEEKAKAPLKNMELKLC